MTDKEEGPSLVGEEEAHAFKEVTTSQSEENKIETEPVAKWKAAISTDIDCETVPTLSDTGCTRTVISEKFVRRHPNLYKNHIKPHKGKTVSIDGSKVETLGIINVPFRINGRFLRMNARIVKNLVYDFVLGWDFFCKYKCSIHPSEGYLQYENERIGKRQSRGRESERKGRKTDRIRLL